MSALRKARLPNDTAGILEDKIADDPLEFTAYEELIVHFRNKSKIDEARQVYEKLLKVLPASAYVWRQYAEMEASENELNRVEAIFSRALMSCLNLDIWNYYLDYIRRTHPLSTGGSAARTVVSQAYEFVLQHVGIDLESGPIWSDYIAFLKTAPASSSWEEQQRNDALRKIYQRAVVTPLNNVESLWRDYNIFENGVNKQTARKFVNEKSPSYMTARATAKELLGTVGPLRSIRYPSRAMASPKDEMCLASWQRWIALEKADAMELEDPALVRIRVKYAFKQCLMYCRFYPEVWYDAAIYYESLGEAENVQEATQTKPSATLREGLDANPKSWLLSFAYAEFEEAAQRYENVKSTFEKLLKDNEQEIAEIENNAQTQLTAAKSGEDNADDGDKANGVASASGSDSESENEDDGEEAKTTSNNRSVVAAVKKIEDDRDNKVQQLSEEGTVAAIMYMRALRRMEGIVSARHFFMKCLGSAHMSWQIYVASALLEHQYNEAKPPEKDGKQPLPIAVRIFTRGMKQFSENVDYILQYISFLLSIRDDTNARALFEQTSAKLDPRKARPLYARWYEYESTYGDLTSAQKLAARMAELDHSSSINLFGQRFSFLGCDPISRRDLGKMEVDAAISAPRGPPPHPLGFPPLPVPIPGSGNLIPPPVPNGFNPPVLPQFQRNASPIAPVFVPPPPPPIHPSLINLIKALPPPKGMANTITFNYAQFLELISGTDLAAAYQTLHQANTSRQTTPRVVVPPVLPTTVPVKRTAAMMVPSPDDLIALGRHNDPKDPYKKRVSGTN